MEPNEKETILIVDDETGPRESLRMVLKPFYTVYIADSGLRAIEMIREKGEIGLVTLDLKMPGLQGTELLKEIRSLRKDIEVIIITGYGSLRSAVDGIRYRVRDYLIKPFNITEIVGAVQRAMEKKRSVDQFKSGLSDLYQRLSEETEHSHGVDASRVRDLLEKLGDGHLFQGSQEPRSAPGTENLQFLIVLVEALEEQTPLTMGHSRRISGYVSLLAEEMHLSEEDQHALQLAAFLHDLGLLGNASTDERIEGKFHPKISAELCGLLGVPEPIAQAVRYHHSPYGQEGPDGLLGKKLPLFSRMIALAEFFDELVTGSPEKASLSTKQAAMELKKTRGRQLDPQLVDSFLNLVEKGGVLPVTREKAR